MKSLMDLWNESGQDAEVKFRFVDWNHKTRYFQIHRLSQDGQYFVGLVDGQTESLFPVNSDFWSYYFEGDEETARAV